MAETLKQQYERLTRERKRVGTELFKKNHGGKTAKEWAKSHKKRKR